MADLKQSFTLEDVEIFMNGNIVGSAQSLTVALEQDNKPIHANGSKKPREILDGQMTYSGSIERLFLDKETITDLVDLENGANPYFDLIGVTKNKNPERKVLVVDAKLKGFSIDFGLTDETKVSQDFDALDLKIN